MTQRAHELSMPKPIAPADAAFHGTGAAGIPHRRPARPFACQRPSKTLMACEKHGRDGTELGGCVKVYVPSPAGRFGVVMAAVSHPERPIGLRVIAFGVRHQPRQANALTVYEIAHRRLHS